MGMFDVLKISASGLHAQRVRMETIATNLANIHTTRTEDGGPFKKLNVVIGSSAAACLRCTLCGVISTVLTVFSALTLSANSETVGPLSLLAS